MKGIVLGLIQFYRRVISTRSPPACRFVPSCSQYAYETIERYGLAKGCWMAIKRLARCHPFNPGGFDPAP